MRLYSKRISLGSLFPFANCDNVFLIFLLFVTQGNIVSLLFAILYIYIFRFRFPNKTVGFSKFYYFIILYSLFSGFINFMYMPDLDYIFPLMYSIFSWVFCFLILIQTQNFIERNDIKKIQSTLFSYFYILVGFHILDVITTILFSPQMIGSMSMGDYFTSIFSNSSLNCIVLSFFSIYFFRLNKWIHLTLSIILMLSTTFNTAILLFFSVCFGYYFLSYRIRLLTKVGTLILLSVVLVVQFFAFRPQVEYYNSVFNKVIKSDYKPRKLTSFSQSYHHWTSSPLNFLFGSGPANFSSRGAFIFGGQYVDWISDNFVYKHSDFKDNHLKLWNTKVLRQVYSDGTINQPFSFYNKIIGEYGFLGFISFLILYIGFIYRNRQKLSTGKLLFFYLLLILLIDYWFEYFCIMVLFELFILLELKSVSGKEMIIDSKEN